MVWAIRSCTLAAGAAALLSTQAVYAAPVMSGPSIDPLVSLSVFGTAQSRSAVCAAGASAAAAGAAVAATQVAPPGCVLPVTAPPPPVPVTQAVPPAFVPPPPAAGIGTLPLLLGLAALLGLGALLLLGDDDAEGDLAPISPA